MSNGFKLLRGGGYAFNVLLRPHTALRCSFLPNNPTVARNASILYRNPTTRLANRLANLNNQLVRRSASTATEHHVHHHSKQWTRERFAAASLLFLIPGSVIINHPVTDYLLAIGLVLHGYWGLYGIFSDYIHGVHLPRIAHGALNVLALLGFLGLCYFNYYDMGLSNGIKKVWAL